MTQAFEENGVFVESDASGNWIVFRPAKSVIYAEIDSAFPAGLDGLSIAIARALCISRGAQPGQAKEAMRLASEFMRGAKEHARRVREAALAIESRFTV